MNATQLIELEAQPRQSGEAMPPPARSGRLIRAAPALARRCDGSLSGVSVYGWHYWITSRFGVSTDDADVKADSTIIAPKVSGYLRDVLVRDNQVVKAGQALAKIFSHFLKYPSAPQEGASAQSRRGFRHPSASLRRGHTGPGPGCTDTDPGYAGGSLNLWTWSNETAISRHSSCPTFEGSSWRQNSVPKPQAIIQWQSPRSSCRRVVPAGWVSASQPRNGLDISLNKTAVYQTSHADTTQGRSRDRSLGLNISSHFPRTSRHYHLLITLCVTVQKTRL